MDLFSFLFIYVVLCAALVFMLLFGESSIFVGTPVASLHWILFYGICDGVWRLTARLFGDRGIQALSSAGDACCNSSNPVLQVFYLGMLAAGYFFYCRDLFCFLPQPYAPVWHQFTGALALGACLAMFLVACMSDPGAITAENLDMHARTYPYGNATPQQQAGHCWTCQWQRPARSKHCSVCKRCVARHDHHCAWINNCVGLLNLKYFLGFLATNVVLTTYAVGLGGIIMKGELDRRKAWQVVFRDPASGQLRRLASSPRVMLRWLLHKYPIQVALLLFLVLGLLLVAGFMAHQLWLIAQGTTTYESFKRMNVQKTLLAQRLAEHTERGEEQPGRRSWWLPGLRRLGRRPVDVDTPTNIFDRGLLWNFRDALMPVSWPGRREVYTQTRKRQ